MERHTVRDHSGRGYAFDLINSQYGPDNRAGLFVICRHLKDSSLENLAFGSTNNLRNRLVDRRKETLREFNANDISGVEIGVLGIHWNDQRAEMLADLRKLGAFMPSAV